MINIINFNTYKLKIKTQNKFYKKIKKNCNKNQKNQLNYSKDRKVIDQSIIIKMIYQ